MIEITAISKDDAKAYLKKNSAFRGEFDQAIAAIDELGKMHGVIVFTLDGTYSKKQQISTDGNAQVGTLLYGAWVRASMALGYEMMGVCAAEGKKAEKNVDSFGEMFAKLYERALSTTKRYS